MPVSRGILELLIPEHDASVTRQEPGIWRPHLPRWFPFLKRWLQIFGGVGNQPLLRELFVTPWTVALQARILECIAISSSRRSSQPKAPTHVYCVTCGFLTTEPPVGRGASLISCEENHRTEIKPPLLPLVHWGPGPQALPLSQTPGSKGRGGRAWPRGFLVCPQAGWVGPVSGDPLPLPVAAGRWTG